jgi:hypothetical protein
MHYRAGAIVLTLLASACAHGQTGSAGNPQTVASAATSAPQQTGTSGTSPHVPFYSSNATKPDGEHQNPGTFVIHTKDSIDAVAAWYRQNLPDQSGETVSSTGEHFFYTHNGSTVAIAHNIAQSFDGLGPTVISIINSSP